MKSFRNTLLALILHSVAALHAQDNWFKHHLSPNPRGIFNSAAAYIGGDNVLLYGGNPNGIGNPNMGLGVISQTWLYDRSANAWVQMIPVNGGPGPRQFHDIAYLGDDKVLLFGGYGNLNDVHPLGDTWVYDLSDNTWTNMSPPSPPAGRVDLKMAYIGCDRVMMFGGAGNSIYSDTTWIYDLSENRWSPRIQPIRPRAENRHAMASTTDGKVVMLGTGNFLQSGETWIYDPALDTWTQKYPSAAPAADFYSAMASLNDDKVLLFGGYQEIWGNSGTDWIHLNATWIYDVSDNTWSQPTTLTTSPRKNAQHVMAETGTGEVLFYGGQIPNDTTWLYQPGTPIIGGKSDVTPPIVTGPGAITLDSDPNRCGAVVSYGLYRDNPVMYCTEFDSKKIYQIDTRSTLQPVKSVEMNITGLPSPITRTHGLARHPVTGQYYAVVAYDINYVHVRALVSVDPVTGNGAMIGTTGINVSGIAFTSAGVLYAIGGSNGPGANQLHTLNLTNGSATYVMNIASGGAKALAYNPDDGLLYHKYVWGFEKIDPANLTRQSIPLTAAPGSYVHDDLVSGMLYKGSGVFLVNNIAWYHLTSSGAWSSPGVSFSNWIKGIADQNPVAIRIFDNCDVTIEQLDGLPSGSLFPLGTTTNTFRITDGSGNVSYFTFTVTVQGAPATASITSTPSIPVNPGGEPNTIYLGFGPQSVTLTASAGTSYSWTPTTGLSCTDCQSPTASPTSTTTYTVSLQNQSGCLAEASMTINVVDIRCGSNPNKVLMCHRCQDAHTICINESSVQSHLDHGDYLGDCLPMPKAAADAKPVLDRFTLVGTYPNPFKHSTTIVYDIAHDAMFRLTVFDALGRIVQTGEHAMQIAGRHTATFDAKNLPDGVYLYRLEANEEILTGVVTLIR